jgi:uncharacterized membrane protein
MGNAVRGPAPARGALMAERSGLPSRFFSEEEQRAIQRAIENAESGTSGEIRVHLDRRCAGDPVAAARAWFDKLGMRATAQRNGVLLYLAIADRKFALYGDKGVDGVLPEGTWERLRDAMVAEFAKGRFVEGIEGAVAAIGEALKTHFPRADDDKDELTDELSTSDE